MPEENKTQNTTKPETKAENQPVATASPEIEDKIEVPTEVILETEEKIETTPEIEEQVKQETPAQPIIQETTPQPQPIPQIKTVEKIVYKTDPNIIQKLLNKARAKIQERKRKKLDKIMTLFETKSQITNKDIQKLLRTTKRTARRYFDQLEQEQKITQIGKVGRSVLYIKKP